MYDQEVSDLLGGAALQKKKNHNKPNPQTKETQHGFPYQQSKEEKKKGSQ